MKVLVYSAAIALLVGCMPPQDNRGEVKSFDANACVNWGNLKKEYEASLSIIDVSGTHDKSKTALLAVLTLSRGYAKPGQFNKPGERLRIEDVFIKQLGSDKPAWDLKGLADVHSPGGLNADYPLQNIDLAVKMHIKAIIAAQEKLSKIDTLKKHIQKELKQGTNMAHYAGTSTDHEGTSEVHLIVGRDAPGKLIVTTANTVDKATDDTNAGTSTAEKKEAYYDEDPDKNYAAYPALLTLFHNGNAYMSDFPAAEARSEDLDKVENIMPGVMDKLAKKYFFGVACGKGDGGANNDNSSYTTDIEAAPNHSKVKQKRPRQEPRDE